MKKTNSKHQFQRALTAAAGLLPDTPRASALDCGSPLPLWTPATGPNAQLPDSDQTVLVALTGRDLTDPVWLGYLDGRTWRYIDAMPISPKQRVTHWMHLPEPPTKNQ